MMNRNRSVRDGARSRCLALVRTLPLLLALASPGEALAWGEAGHRAVGDLAWDRLTPVARERVTEIIKTGNPGDAPNCAARTLSDVAALPDCVRGNPRYRSWTPLHYADIPVCGDAAPDVYCPEGRCIIGALGQAEQALRDKRTSPRQQFLALALMSHLVGDLHQPLHMADNGDRGGNAIAVSGLGEFNLHHTWDTTLVRAALPPGRAGLEILRSTAGGHERVWQSGSFGSWGAETHAIALKVYAGLPDPPACNRSATTERINDLYVNAASKIVRVQLAKSGIRLAAKLNDIFR
jgi:hypothetical protein